MSKLIEAADFPVIVELKLSNSGTWKRYACMINAGITYSKENQESLDLNCGSSSYSDTVAEMKLNMFRVLDSDLMKMLVGSKTVVIPAGAYAVSELHKVYSDNTVQLPYTSNDNAGVTAVVVKSGDGSITYVDGTDYSIATVNNVTTITIIAGGAINPGSTVLVEGSVNLNETKKVVTTLGTKADSKLDVRFIGQKEIEGTNYNFSLTAMEGSNTSSYNVEFINRIKGGLPKGTEVAFKFDTNEVVMLDEISSAEMALRNS